MNTSNQLSQEKTPPISKAYWYCQLVGWSVYLAFQMFVLTALKPEGGPSGPRVYGAIALLDVTGFLLSHLFYLQMRRRHWLQMPLRRALPRLFFALYLTAAAQTGLYFLVIAFLVPHNPLYEPILP